MAIIKTKYRSIKTKIPVPASAALLKEMQKYEASEMCNHELPVIWDRADDFQVHDKWGNTWIDFTSGIFVASVGHASREVSAAVLKMAKNKLLHAYVFPNEARLKLAKELCSLVKMDKVLLTVTGSEANDAVIQMMRHNRKGKILSIKGAYYGSTTACRQLAEHTIDESVKSEGFDPKAVSGIFLQAFRGRDAKFMPYDWVREWVKWAQKNKIPVGFDEMQSGFARTGKWFGFQHYGIKPDFITIGKAFGGGLPISAVVGRKELLQFSGDLWSTHTGNPVCCGAALAVLKTIKEKKLVEKTAEKDKWLRELFKKSFPNNEVYGKGMIWAIWTGDSKITQKIIQRCAEKGLLLVSTHGPAIKIGPPLTIPDGALREGIDVIKESFDSLKK